MPELIFSTDGAGRLPLPERCPVDITCLIEPEVQDAVMQILEENLVCRGFRRYRPKSIGRDYRGHGLPGCGVVLSRISLCCQFFEGANSRTRWRWRGRLRCAGTGTCAFT